MTCLGASVSYRYFVILAGIAYNCFISSRWACGIYQQGMPLPYLTELKIYRCAYTRCPYSLIGSRLEVVWL